MIIAEVGTSKFKIGTAFNKDSEIFTEIEDRDYLLVYKSKSIWVLIDKESKLIDQVSVFRGFSEKTEDLIGIGSNIREVKSVYGKLIKNDNVYEPLGLAGIAFEFSKKMEINCISVCGPRRFREVIPEHIANQGKRRLP